MTLYYSILKKKIILAPLPFEISSPFKQSSIHKRLNTPIKQLYTLQQSCKLTSSVLTSASSFRFANSPIPWFESKSGNHHNTAIWHTVLGQEHPNSTTLYCLSHLDNHDNTLAKWHHPYPSQHRATASPNRRFRASNPRAEITEHSNLSYRNCVISVPNHPHIIAT